MAIRMSDADGRKTCKYYACSNCWGVLNATMVIEHAADGKLVFPDLVDVSCDTPDCECRGFIAKGTVKRRLQEAKQQGILARQSLRDAFPELRLRFNKGESEAEIIRELGF